MRIAIATGLTILLLSCSVQTVLAAPKAEQHGQGPPKKDVHDTSLPPEARTDRGAPPHAPAHRAGSSPTRGSADEDGSSPRATTHDRTQVATVEPVTMPSLSTTLPSTTIHEMTGPSTKVSTDHILWPRPADQPPAPTDDSWSAPSLVLADEASSALGRASGVEHAILNVGSASSQAVLRLPITLQHNETGLGPVEQGAPAQDAPSLLIALFFGTLQLAFAPRRKKEAEEERGFSVRPFRAPRPAASTELERLLKIPGEEMRRLEHVGVDTLERLLASDPDAIAFWSGIRSETIRQWQDKARGQTASEQPPEGSDQGRQG